MFEKVPRWILAGIYLLAVAIGWWGGSILPGGSKGESTQAISRRSVGREVESSIDPGQLLLRLEEEQKKESGKNERARVDEQYRAKIAALRNSLVPAADRRAAALAAMAGEGKIGKEDDEASMAARAEIAVRVLQWMESDPKGALDHLTAEEHFTSCPFSALEIWAKGTPKAAIFELLTPELIRSGAGKVMLAGLAAQIGESADLNGVAELHRRLSDHGWMNEVDGMVAKWPMERRAELLPKAMELGDGRMAAAVLLRMKPADACAHIQSLLATEDGTALLKEGGASGLSYVIVKNKDLPLEQRMAMMTTIHDLEGDRDSRNAVRLEVMNQNYNEFAAGEDSEELMRAFEDGKKDARQVAAEMSAAMPEAESLDPKVVQLQVLRRLLARDPARALEMLEDLPPQERHDRALLYSEVGNADPQLVYQLHEAVPFDPVLDQMDSRKDTWKRATQVGLKRYDDRYATWVEGLPPGENRDLALSALADQVADENPQQAADLRSKISRAEGGK